MHSPQLVRKDTRGIREASETKGLSTIILSCLDPYRRETEVDREWEPQGQVAEFAELNGKLRSPDAQPTEPQTHENHYFFCVGVENSN